jgi:hypothetical protein
LACSRVSYTAWATYPVGGEGTTGRKVGLGVGFIVGTVTTLPVVVLLVVVVVIMVLDVVLVTGVETGSMPSQLQRVGLALHGQCGYKVGGPHWPHCSSLVCHPP